MLLVMQQERPPAHVAAALTAQASSPCDILPARKENEHRSFFVRRPTDVTEEGLHESEVNVLIVEGELVPEARGRGREQQGSVNNRTEERS